MNILCPNRKEFLNNALCFFRFYVILLTMEVKKMDEWILNGYCTILDGPRTVFCQMENGQLVADCGYDDCPHASHCPIGKQIATLSADVLGGPHV